MEKRNHTPRHAAHGAADHHPSRGARVTGSNDDVDGERGMASAMMEGGTAPNEPMRVRPAPTMEATLGPGSRSHSGG